MPVTCFLCGCSDRFEIIRNGTKLEELYCKHCDVFTPIVVATPMKDVSVNVKS